MSTMEAIRLLETKQPPVYHEGLAQLQAEAGIEQGYYGAEQFYREHPEAAGFWDRNE